MEKHKLYRAGFTLLALLAAIENLTHGLISFLPLCGSDMAQTGLVLTMTFAYGEWIDLNDRPPD